MARTTKENTPEPKDDRVSGSSNCSTIEAIEKMASRQDIPPGAALQAIRSLIHCNREDQKHTDANLQQKMQLLMYCLTKEAARHSYREFLDNLSINNADYAEIKKEWKEKLGVTPYV